MNIIDNILVNSIFSSSLVHPKLRNILYRLYGITIGKGVCIYSHCFIGGKDIHIGNNVFINHNCFLDNSGTITIGDNVSIGMNVLFCTSVHYIGDSSQRAGKVYGKSITIEEGCWIGANCTILPGVTIKKGTIVGAGSVVTKSCKQNSVYVGNPAQMIKELSEE